jgi:hypothetical protein
MDPFTALIDYARVSTPDQNTETQIAALRGTGCPSSVPTRCLGRSGTNRTELETVFDLEHMGSGPGVFGPSIGTIRLAKMHRPCDPGAANAKIRRRALNSMLETNVPYEDVSPVELATRARLELFSTWRRKEGPFHA